MSPKPAASPKTILLVDDDSAVVKALNKTLGNAGYTVLPAETQEEAIAAAKSTPDIDLLIVDAVMPTISGPELAEMLLFLRPAMKVLFITGLDGLTIHLAFSRPCAFLQKPFTLKTVVSKVEELLRGGVQTSGDRPADPTVI